jgi:hypothetical protein
MNTVYNVSYKDRIKKQEIQEEVLVDYTYLVSVVDSFKN